MIHRMEVMDGKSFASPINMLECLRELSLSDANTASFISSGMLGAIRTALPQDEAAAIYEHITLYVIALIGTHDPHR